MIFERHGKGLVMNPALPVQLSATLLFFVICLTKSLSFFSLARRLSQVPKKYFRPVARTYDKRFIEFEGSFDRGIGPDVRLTFGRRGKGLVSGP